MSFKSSISIICIVLLQTVFAEGKIIKEMEIAGFKMMLRIIFYLIVYSAVPNRSIASAVFSLILFSSM